MGTPDGLHRQLQSIQFTDAEIKRLGANASAEARSLMKTLEGKTGTAAQIRRGQIALAKINAEMWANINHVAKVGIGDAVWNATEAQALFDEALFGKVGISSQYWKASMIAQAKAGVDNLVSRKTNGISLSQRVYKQQALSAGKLDDILNSALLLGKSQREIAKDVIQVIDPATPGGVTYAAQRLARTEVANAYHATSVRKYQETPWVEKVRWNLSGSHARPDKCNEYAESVHHTGWDAGEYRPSEVPSKPHPQCLCYVDPVVEDLDAFAKKFKQGKYDDYIDNQMGCFRSA